MVLIVLDFIEKKGILSDVLNKAIARVKLPMNIGRGQSGSEVLASTILEGFCSQVKKCDLNNHI